MKKVLITFKKEETTPRLQELTNSIKKYLNEEIEIVASYGYSNLEIYSDPLAGLKIKINDHDISKFEVVYMYTLSSANYDISCLIAQFCEYKGIKYINSREKFNYHVGKILQKVLLTLNNIPTPRFYFSNNLSTLSYDYLSNLIGERFILKQSKANLGKKVFLINNEEELITKLSSIKHNDDNDGLWFIEEFIPHKNTYRGFVSGEECKTQIHVSKEVDSFKTNHGQAVFSREVIAEVKELAVRAAQLLELQVSGVDIVFDENDKKYKVFEVNKSPGITIKDTLESFEAEDIANYINNLLN